MVHSYWGGTERCLAGCSVYWLFPLTHRMGEANEIQQMVGELTVEAVLHLGFSHHSAAAFPLGRSTRRGGGEAGVSPPGRVMQRRQGAG